MTDIVERLRSGTTDGTALTWTVTPIHREAADEIERLRAGLMKAMQYENKCDETGKPCREASQCGCYLEANTWCED